MRINAKVFNAIPCYADVEFDGDALYISDGRFEAGWLGSYALRLDEAGEHLRRAAKAALLTEAKNVRQMGRDLMQMRDPFGPAVEADEYYEVAPMLAEVVPLRAGE